MPPLWSHAIKLIGVKIIKEIEERQSKKEEKILNETKRYSRNDE